MYNTSSGNALAWNNGSDRMMLDASGKLSNSASSSNVASFNGTGGSGGYVTFENSAVVYGDIGTANQIVSGGSVSDFGINARGARNLIFGTNNAERVRIDASGNLLVGATSASLTDSDSFVFAKTGKYGAFQHSTGTVTASRYLYFAYAGAEIGSITQNGTTATSFNTTSDHRLKENVRPSNASRFCDIQFRDFEWIDGRHDCGVIAHELQAIYPDRVFGEKDATEEVEYEISPTVPAVLDDEGNEVTPAVEAVIGTKTQPKYQQVNYTGLIARMGTVVQRHEKTIEAMQAQLDAQNTAMQLLASRLAALEAA